MRRAPSAKPSPSKSSPRKGSPRKNTREVEEEEEEDDEDKQEEDSSSDVRVESESSQDELMRQIFQESREKWKRQKIGSKVCHPRFFALAQQPLGL